MTGREVVAYAAAQIVGGVLGAVLANVMFDLPAGQISTKDRVIVGHGVGEVVATAGLVLLIFALARTGRAALSAAAVGAYIGSAYWFTSSTSFANPAVTIGRMFSDTFAGIAPGSAPLFIAAQLVGARVGLGLVRCCSPTPPPRPPGPSSPTPTPPPRRADAVSKPSVLFVCVHNAGRSQMAAAFLTHLSQGPVEVRSAGSAPADQVNPAAVQAMAEVGIDIAAETAEDPHRPCGPRVRCGDHHGLRRHLPLLPRQAVRGLGARRPRRQGRRLGPAHPRRDPPTGRAAARRARPRMSPAVGPMRLVIVGGSDAGISAALRARELDPTTEVTVVVADGFPNFSICGIPYFISGRTVDSQLGQGRHADQADRRPAAPGRHRRRSQGRPWCRGA